MDLLVDERIDADNSTVLALLQQVGHCNSLMTSGDIEDFGTSSKRVSQDPCGLWGSELWQWGVI
jgi:hypothetical protein